MSTEATAPLPIPAKVVDAFREVETAAKLVRPRLSEISLYTPITEHFFHHDLAVFWGRLQWISDYRLPPLRRSIFLRRPDDVLVVILVAPISTLVIVLNRPTSASSGIDANYFLRILLGLTGVMIISLATIFFTKWVRSRFNPLPIGFRTFGDVARFISGEWLGCCQKCGYDLSGNVSGLCPECGWPIPWASGRPKQSSA